MNADFIRFVCPGLPVSREKELAREILTAVKHLPGQHDQKTHGIRGGSSQPEALNREPGAIPANSIVSGAPKDLQDIIDNTYISDSPTNMPDIGAAIAPTRFSDGSYLFYYRPGIRKTKSTIIHETVHAQQGDLLRTNPKRHDYLSREFEIAGRKDLSVKNALWTESITRNGGELWASAVGYYYGGSRSMMEQSSPNVSQLIKDIYQ